MSELIHVKALIATSVRENQPAEIAKAVVNFINALDNDLDTLGYECSTDMDNAIIALNSALSAIDEESASTSPDDEDDEGVEDETEINDEEEE